MGGGGCVNYQSSYYSRCSGHNVNIFSLQGIIDGHAHNRIHFEIATGALLGMHQFHCGKNHF